MDQVLYPGSWCFFVKDSNASVMSSNYYLERFSGCIYLCCSTFLLEQGDIKYLLHV